MAIEITIPPLGWSSDAALFAGWLKRDGDAIRPGDALYSLESEKATQEIESLDGGVLRILPGGPKEGDKVAVGTVIASLMQAGETTPIPDNVCQAVAKPANGADAPAGPAVRRLARQLDVDVRQVSGSGKAGRVMPEDVHRHHQAVSAGPESRATAAQQPRRKGPAISPRAKRIATELGIDWTPLHGTGRTGRIRERDIRAATSPMPRAQTVPITPLRKTIATRMLHSAQSTAPVTLTTTADATNLVSLRNQFKDIAASANMPVPGYTDFIVKLVAVALKQHPQLNARWEGDHIAFLPAIHIGIAVDTDAGLLVPVLRDVPGLGLRELAARSRDLIERARLRKLSSEEMQGGTFTVTNLGAFDIDAFTPILNVPEAAILGVGRIQRQPVVLGEQIVVRDMISLSLTFDHRIVDGAPAARFLQMLGQLVKNPSPWLLV